jgi:medium-chain acyl-[acyl-carrier-protein] hydrolase
VLDVLEPAVRKLGRPFALFGHSMGAGMAFELARRVEPEALIVSAARAPKYRTKPYHGPEPTDAELLEQIRAAGGNIPSHGLELILPSLRADTMLYRHWVFDSGSPVSAPIIAYGGSEDPNVKCEHIDAWRQHTTGAFRKREFAGGHFYLTSVESEFLSALQTDLSEISHPRIL